MILELQREPTKADNKGFTLGELLIDGSWFCYTLEDELRESKVFGETAIPAGTYELGFVDSPRFGKDSIAVKNVPGFSHILIHGGNTEAHTAGCILVGYRKATSTIERSQAALNDLKNIIKDAILDGQTVFLTIKNAPDDVYVDTGNSVNA